ncbi:MAG: 3-phosphoshikimate 1-carboxyvinyltransferase [Saprospiraceae bacterium]|jgi:3-phosphoshikimate 1-carboxyvinyltransferase
MKGIIVTAPNKHIKGNITLSGSKSISNRVLLIKALCGQSFAITNISDSDDTATLEKLLHQPPSIYDAHHAGTTFRFMTGYLALQPSTKVLTGSERMKQRPIGALVDALNHLGANIRYLEVEGYPPLEINAPNPSWKNEISLTANISSQYISTLLLIAPTMPNGLKIHLEGEPVSRPYIEMTLDIMRYFGVHSTWNGPIIEVAHQPYIPKDYFVEADWSAASYYYAMCAMSESAEITLYGLNKESVQGDAAIAEISKRFGVETSYGDHYITISKGINSTFPSEIEYNFVKVPDIAQTISVVCAGLGINGLFSGLQTLRIKETDRIAALQSEWSKLGVFFTKMPEKFSRRTKVEYYLQEGEAKPQNGDIPTIETYNDHRMALAFAALALKFPIKILNPLVVSKSYPKFWHDLRNLGFEISDLG